MSSIGGNLRGKRITDVFNVIKDVDCVELKLTVPDSDRASAIAVLDMDVLQAELRQVIFFDTPDLKLNRAGMIVRARRTRGGGDTVIKLRPMKPADLPPKFLRSKRFKVELDASPDDFVCSGSLRGKINNGDVKDVLRGRKAIRKLFSAEQRDFYREHAPKRLSLDSLTPLGPINVAKLQFAPKKYNGRTMTAELWFYPDSSRILELSTKCAHDEAFQVAADTRAFLRGCGIAITDEQPTKTHKALQYFSRLHDQKQVSPSAA
jgi:hypothetical protein